MIKYNKLIRDKIPEIIEADGKDYEVKKLEDDEYLKSLNTKLQEELDEYQESGEIEELADLLEIIYAILDHKDISREELERIRKEKKQERGGFSRKLLLIGVEDK